MAAAMRKPVDQAARGPGVTGPLPERERIRRRRRRACRRRPFWAGRRPRPRSARTARLTVADQRSDEQAYRRSRVVRPSHALQSVEARQRVIDHGRALTAPAWRACWRSSPRKRRASLVIGRRSPRRGHWPGSRQSRSARVMRGDPAWDRSAGDRRAATIPCGASSADRRPRIELERAVGGDRHDRLAGMGQSRRGLWEHGYFHRYALLSRCRCW